MCGNKLDDWPGTDDFWGNLTGQKTVMKTKYDGRERYEYFALAHAEK